MDHRSGARTGRIAIKLHGEAVRFTGFHVSPLCSPTRAALMTGNHPGFTGPYRVPPEWVKP